MRKLLIVWLSVAVMHNLQAQQFKQISKVKLSDVVDVSQAKWVNLNRDTLLDVVLTGKTSTGELKIFTFENLTGLGLAERETLLTDIQDGKFVLTDYDLDNQVDLLVYGRNDTTGLIQPFQNTGNFSLSESDIVLPVTASELATFDLNSDGVSELITHESISEKSHIRIYTSSNNTYTLHSDTVGITVSDLKIFDFNKDGFADILLSGSNEVNEPVVQLWINQDSLKFKINALISPVNGKLSLMDFNADGYFDVWAVGLDSSGDRVKVMWKNNTGDLQVESVESEVEPLQIFSGDMNADGLADQWIFGKTDTDKINKIITVTDTIQLDTVGLLLIEPGDFNRDGNLDFLQVIDSADGIWIKLYTNLLEVKNQRPNGSAVAFGISAFNRAFIYWSPATDESTASISLTYDVWLKKNDESILMPNYNLIHKRRDVVDHGNNFTNTFKVFGGVPDDGYAFEVQTIDNGFNGGYVVCKGDVIPCFDIEPTVIEACRGSVVELVSDEMSYWFSLERGFLGVSETLSFTASKTDTVFSFIPQLTNCSKNRAWAVNVITGNVSASKNVFTCIDNTIKLGIPSGWNSITWNTNPAIVNQDTISVLVKQPQTISVEAHAFECTLQYTFVINLSKPDLTITPDRFQIQRGNAVQLEASSNASLFQWSPAAGLSDPTILNPLAAPPRTTTYTLVVTDSLGCTNTGNVKIEVQQTGFIPDLFTPNRDGKNDVLLVYGLTQTTSFQFRIFNREGSVVYQTDNVNDALASGWNGTTNGNEQPAGMYYWRVEGLLPGGEEVLLNGNKTGSVFLMR